MRYRSKVVEVEAVRWNGVSFQPGECPQWLIDAIRKDPDTPGGAIRMGPDVHIFTLEGTMIARPDDWIIRGTEGELYPCKPSVFERKYEPA